MPFDIDTYGANGWKSALSDDFGERLELGAGPLPSPEEIQRAFQERDDWWEGQYRIRNEAAHRPLAGMVGPHVLQARKNLREALSTLKGQAGRAAYEAARLQSLATKQFIPLVDGALADRILTAAEEDWLREKAKKMGLPEDMIDRMIEERLRATGSGRQAEKVSSAAGAAPTALGWLNHYEVLGVSETATHKEIDDAWQRACGEFIRDADKTRANARMFVVTRAHEVLRDPARRRAFDAELQRERAMPVPRGTPRLEVSACRLVYSGVQVGRVLSGTVVVQNVGGGSLTGTVTPSKPWLRVILGNLAPDVHRQQVTFSVVTRDFRPGENHEADLALRTNGGEEHIRVRVEMELPEKLLSRVRKLLVIPVAVLCASLGLASVPLGVQAGLWTAIALALVSFYREAKGYSGFNPDAEAATAGCVTLVVCLLPLALALINEMTAKTVAACYGALLCGGSVAWCAARWASRYPGPALRNSATYLWLGAAAAWAAAGFMASGRSGTARREPVSPRAVAERLPRAIVTSEDVVNLRGGPTKTATILRRAKRGATFRVVGQEDDWWRVVTSDEGSHTIEAWLAKAVVARAATASEAGAAWTDDFEGVSIGDARGVRFVPAIDGLGAEFSRSRQSRLEFPGMIPQEGTVEAWVNVRSGYKFEDSRLHSDLTTAYLFTTDNYGADVNWPGGAGLDVTADGTVSFRITAVKYGKRSNVAVARSTRFRFGQWQALGVSYGRLGQSIMLNGELVAADAGGTQVLAAGGTHNAQTDVPTFGEAVSGHWSPRQWAAGFEGVVSRLRISPTQADWVLAKGLPSEAPAVFPTPWTAPSVASPLRAERDTPSVASREFPISAADEVGSLNLPKGTAEAGADALTRRLLLGKWDGTIGQPGFGESKVVLALTRIVWDEDAGVVVYPSLGCTAKLRFVGTSSGVFRFEELGLLGTCGWRRSVRISLLGDDRLVFWRGSASDEGAGQGVLGLRGRFPTPFPQGHDLDEVLAELQPSPAPTATREGSRSPRRW